MATLDGGFRLAVAAGATKDAQLRRRRFADAAVLLRQALAEDSSLARAHDTLGCALWEGEADTDGAEAAFWGHRVRPELQQVHCLYNKVIASRWAASVCVIKIHRSKMVCCRSPRSVQMMSSVQCRAVSVYDVPTQCAVCSVRC